MLKGGLPVKFKVFSVVLLAMCFLVLGVMSGAIPVTVPGRSGPEEPVMDAVPAGALPTARVMSDEPATPAPVRTPAPAAPSAAAETPEASETEAPAASPKSTAPSASPAARPTPEPTDTAAPTDTPEPTPTPEPTAAPAAPEAADLWQPEAVVASTTITWVNDPLNNETDHKVDARAMLSQPLNISLPEEGPQILIIHTHGTEAYTPAGEDGYEAVDDYRTLDRERNVTRVGRALGQALEEYGLDAVMDEQLFDWPAYDGAYARCGQAIEDYLAKYPTISMVIDLHRDAIGSEDKIYRAVSDQTDPAAAQCMFVMGSDGALSYPKWEDNLALAMSLQGLVDEAFPHLMRPAILCGNRYNQQLTAGSLLLEVGATGNTLQEALTAVDLFAQAVGPALAERVGA